MQHERKFVYQNNYRKYTKVMAIVESCEPKSNLATDSMMIQLKIKFYEILCVSSSDCATTTFVQTRIQAFFKNNEIMFMSFQSV